MTDTTNIVSTTRSNRRARGTRRKRVIFLSATALLLLLDLPSTLAFYPSIYPSSFPKHHQTSEGKSLEEGDQPRKPRQQWVTCSSSKEISHAIRKLVRPGDRVAELGSQLREVSTAICETVGEGQVVLVDTVRKFPKNAPADSHRTQAMRRVGEEEDFFPQCSAFYEIDRLDDWRQAFFNNGGQSAEGEKYAGYDVLVLDVNSIVGNDLEWTTLSLIREFLALNGDACRLVLVKSLSLNQWASRLNHGQRWCRQGGLAHTAAKTDYTQKGPAPCYIVATVGVPEYRETIPHTVKSGDAVLEIGCHLGTSTALIHETAVKVDPGSGNCGYCIGVDIGNKIIKGAQQRHSQIYFEVGDAWRTAALLRTQQTFLDKAAQEGKDHITAKRGFDVVYVDVGGLSGQDGTIESLSLLSALANAFEPRCIVIKSVCMRRLSSTLVPYWKLQK